MKNKFNKSLHNIIRHAKSKKLSCFYTSHTTNNRPTRPRLQPRARHTQRIKRMPIMHLSTLSLSPNPTPIPKIPCNWPKNAILQGQTIEHNKSIHSPATALPPHKIQHTRQTKADQAYHAIHHKMTHGYRSAKNHPYIRIKIAGCLRPERLF